MQKILLACVAVFVPMAASAEGTVYLGGELRYETSDSADQTFAEGYVEYEAASGIYAGLWLTTLGTDAAPDDYEYEPYFGYRGAFGGVDYDIGYGRYIDDHSGYCCGEAVLKLTYSAGDLLAFETDLAYGDSPSGSYSYATQEIDFTITDQIQPYLSGTWYDKDSNDSDEWKVGVNFAVNDTTALDLAYHTYGYGSDLVSFAVSFDTDWATLTGK
ncbi:MAG: hypothetical protein ABI459_00525 [Deltaproteobacteria bacterium]